MKRQISVLRRLLLCCGVVLLGSASCARSGSGSNEPVPAPFADLAAPEIMHGQFVTAYDAVYGLRHEFLTMADHHARGALAVDATVVYVDGVRAGGLDALALIPASEVRSIHLVKPIDTTGALGTRLTGGAILVETTRRTVSTASEPSAASYLEFHNETEDAVRVFLYAGHESWFIGDVQPFRRAWLVLPTSLTMRHGQAVSVGAVPIGGRGRDGTAATGAVVRSDTEIIDDVADFRWTLTGHTLSAAQLPHRSREHDE